MPSPAQLSPPGAFDELDPGAAPSCALQALGSQLTQSLAPRCTTVRSLPKMPGSRGKVTALGLGRQGRRNGGHHLAEGSLLLPPLPLSTPEAP